MKKLFKILMFAVLTLPFGSCDVEYDPIVTLPNVSLDNSGLTTVPTVSIYQNDAYTVTLARTEGLSRAAEFDIVVDQALLDEYNELNGASFQMMPSSVYTIGVATVSFPEKSKTATFTIQVKPQSMVTAAGSVEKAANYVIPFACIPKNPVNAPAPRLSALVRFTFASPVVTVDAPVEPEALTFIAGVEVPRVLQLSCQANFTTLQPAKLSFVATQQLVDGYNQANATEYRLLPTSCFAISAGKFDSEKRSLAYDITLEASKIDPDQVYLLPLKMASNDYTIIQDNIYYVIVSIQEIQFSVAKTDRYEVATKLIHRISLDVQLNGALAKDVPVEFAYDAGKIAAYNQSKGKVYEAFDAAKISVTKATMTAGAVKVSSVVSVDLAGLEFENGKEYVLPFVLDKSKLPQGAVMTSEDVVYVRLKRTLYGTWSNSKSDGYVIGSAGWTSDNYMKATTSPYAVYTDKGWKYCYCNFYYSWARGYHWYVAWDEVYAGDPNKRVIHAFSSATSGLSDEQNRDYPVDLGSHFDMTEGKVWFNFQYFYSEADKEINKRQTIKCYLESPLTVSEF